MNENNIQLLNQNTLNITYKNRSFNVLAYFIDLDGTLLDKNISKNISKKNIEVVKERNKHYPVIISTGRSYNEKVIEVMNVLDIQYAICQNGSIIVDNKGNILKNIELKNKQIEDVLKIIKKYNLSFTVNSKYFIYSSSKNYWFWKCVFGKKITKIDNFDSNKYHVNKLVIGGKLNRKKISKYADEIEHLIPEASVKVSGNDYIIEITDKSATKGRGANFVCNQLKIDSKNTIHIGDSENDSTTLDYVGALIAVKNASKNLLNVATHIGPKNSRGGVAKVMMGEFKEIKHD